MNYSYVHRSQGLSGDVVVAFLQFLFPAVYEAGWKPIAKMAIAWGMIVILVILVRMPMPTEFPHIPPLPDISQMFGGT